MECADCEFVAKSGAGLSAHRRAKHPTGGRNTDALTRTLSELERMGRLEPVDAARVQALRSMAVALDGDASNAALWRQYREALTELRADDDADDSFAQALAQIRGATPMGDTQTP